MIVMACQHYQTPVDAGRALYAFWHESCTEQEECVYDTQTGELNVYDVESEALLRGYNIQGIEEYYNARSNNCLR